MARFSRIRYAIKKLGATGSGITAYQQFRGGQSTYNVASRSRGAGVRKSIIPFGLPEANRVGIIVSGRADPPQFGISDNDLGWKNREETDKPSPRGFQPAKLIVFNGDGAPSTPRSQITGIEYKKRGGQSYTYPFGRTSQELSLSINTSEYTRFLDLVAGMQPGGETTVRRATYKPEKFGQR